MDEVILKRKTITTVILIPISLMIEMIPMMLVIVKRNKMRKENFTRN